MKLEYKRLFSDWEIAVAKKLVNGFRERWPCLQQEDFEDLLQECLTHWFFVKDVHDPAREASAQTFMGRVVRNKLTDLVRERQADKRKMTHLAASLDESLGNDEDSSPLQDTVADRHQSPVLQIELKIDLSTVNQKLNPKQRKLCHLLGEDGLNIKEASECLKAPRSTIYDELKRIRNIFMKEELEDYLK